MEALKIYNELINYEEKNMISKQLIRLSLYLNRFSSLIRFCMENYDFLERSNTIESQIIKAYLAYKNGNLDFPIQDFMRRLSDTDEFSVLSYVVAQMVEDKVLKKDYLKEIIKRKPRHLGALAELARLGEPLSLLELTDIYQNDDSLFEHYFKKSKGSNRKLDFTFTPLGGGDDIGASCYLLQLGKQNFLIDAGIKLKRGSEEYPDFEKLETLCPLKELTMVIITHAHLDHCGGILELYKRNKNLTFVMTRQTKELLRVNLGANQGMESYYLLEELLQSSIILNFNQPLRIGQEGMTMELYPAGHILGAAALWIQSPQGNIFMTSDYCLRNQYTVQGFQVEDLPVDVLITETTYGNRKQCNTFLTNQAEQELVDYVIEKINQGKKVLIPAFAIGRSQELLCMLKQAAKVHQFRLYLDGQVQAVNKIYEKESSFTAQGKNIYNVSNIMYEDKSTFIVEEFLNNRSCVITSSGMLEEGTTSSEYAKHVLKREDGVCILTGFQAADTLGGRLRQQMKLDCERYIDIEGTYYKIQAELIQFHLSAHCNSSDILAVTTKLKPRHVILVHGECKEDKTYIHQVLEKVVPTIQSHNGHTIKIKES